MDKLGNNFKMLLRNGELKCVLKAGYNANIAQDTGIHPGDLSVEAADLQCVKEKKSVMPSPQSRFFHKEFKDRFSESQKCKILTEELWVYHSSLPLVLWKGWGGTWDAGLKDQVAQQSWWVIWHLLSFEMKTYPAT